MKRKPNSVVAMPLGGGAKGCMEPLGMPSSGPSTPKSISR